MTVAMKNGLNETHDHNLQTLFHDSIEALKDKQIDFGAHTDDHNNGAESLNSGCGACKNSLCVNIQMTSRNRMKLF